MCMLVADGGPAHHWQAAHRHGQSRLQPDELCSYTLSHKPSKELMWSVVHNNSSSKARWGPLVFLTYQHEGCSLSDYIYVASHSKLACIHHTCMVDGTH